MGRGRPCATDSWDNTASTYAGTIRFRSPDLNAQLPANYTFSAADGGEHEFSITLNTPGRQIVAVNDTANVMRKGRIDIAVLSTIGSAHRSHHDSVPTNLRSDRTNANETFRRAAEVGHLHALRRES